MTTALPKKYAYLARESGPRMLLQGLAKFGTREIVGVINDKNIMKWAKQVGLERDFTADEIPWCGLFMAVCAVEAGWVPPKIALRALAWLTFGEEREGPAQLGDVLVFERVGGGHVGMYVGEDETHYHVLGGNQGNCVCIARFPKKWSGKKTDLRFRGARKPVWKNYQPENVRRIWVGAEGLVETSVV